MKSVPLTPRNSEAGLQVLLIGRVSKPEQDIANIPAGYEYAKKALDYKDPMHFKELGEQGSGLRTDRETILEAAEEIESGRWDVVLMEDISKPYRNPRWSLAFIQDAIDAGCRVIAPGDCLDSADENFEVMLGAAALRHGLHIPDVRRRVKRTATYSFGAGGMVQKIIYGYRKLTKEEAASGNFGPTGLRLTKLPECTPIAREMKDRVLAGQHYEAVADWLNEAGILPGPYVTSKRWSGRLVKAYLEQPLLSGTRQFRRMLSQPIYKTGKHRRYKNPNGSEKKQYPELAHFTVEEHQELLDFMKQRAALASNGKRPGPRVGVPRSRVLWPAQHPICVCGALMYSYDTCLKCSASPKRSEKACWNHVQVSPKIVREKVLGRLLDYCGRFPQFKAVMVDAAWEAFQTALRRDDYADGRSAKHIAKLEKEEMNLARAIALGGDLEALVKELSNVQEALKSARAQHEGRKERATRSPSFTSKQQMANGIDQALATVAETSYEFADFMRRIIPAFVIQPVQALDSGLVRPRARITVSLAALGNSRKSRRDYTPQPGDFSFSVDLFDPAMHIKHMPACVCTKADNPRWTLKTMAAHLGISQMTVKRALNYHRRMEREGLKTPYRELSGPPKSASRWIPRRKAS